MMYLDNLFMLRVWARIMCYLKCINLGINSTVKSANTLLKKLFELNIDNTGVETERKEKLQYEVWKWIIA